MDKFTQYLSAIQKPFKKLAKLDFLQPDGSVAFTLGNQYNPRYRNYRDTRAFLQDGTLNVALQNGQRRKASITLANVDSAFSYSVNNIWFGRQIRLSMGVLLPDGTEFYLPQGVFYIDAPQENLVPNSRTITYNLVDKWAYLDGSLFGTVPETLKVLANNNGVTTNVFDAMASLLRFSKYDFSENETDVSRRIDNVTPVFTTYYNGKTYPLYTGGTAAMTNVPYDVMVQAGGNIADLMLELNGILAGWIGYDITGALRVDASQDDINDVDKPILWRFTPENSILFGLTETAQNGSVCNEVIIAGEGLEDHEIYGIASNFDPKSDTNINLIGRRPYREAKATYWNAQQCVDLAEFYLKRKTVLQKSVAIQCAQMFHLTENSLVTVKRTDKAGEPIEKHLIQSFSLPIGEKGDMSINCVSVNDYPVITTSSSMTV